MLMPVNHIASIGPETTTSRLKRKKHLDTAVNIRLLSAMENRSISYGKNRRGSAFSSGE